MNLNRNFAKPAFALMALVATACTAQAALISLPVEGWAVHNQSSPATVVGGSGNSPTFTPADGAATVMGTFSGVELNQDGDYVRLTTTLTMGTRTTSTGENNLNTQLRIGLFNGPDDGPVVLEDTPNHGIFIVYGNHNQAGNRRMRFTDTATISPFSVSPTNIIGNSGSEDVDSDSLRGGEVGPVVFELMLTRNADLLDIYGKISGTDSVTGNPYISEYAHTGFDPGNIGFDFNRAGFFFGPQVDAPNATLNNVTVETNVPEPATCILATCIAIGGGLMCRRRASRWLAE